MISRSGKWWVQLCGCYRKGKTAALAGKPRESPYRGGSNVQAQRSDHWLMGWDAGAVERAAAEDAAFKAIEALALPPGQPAGR